MESVVVILGLIPLVLAGSLEDCPPVVKESKHFKDRFRDTCYLFVPEEVYWSDARAACWDLGGEMLMLRDQETMMHISDILDSSSLGWRNSGVWLGAEYWKGKWIWTTGEVVSYKNWAYNQGNSILPGLSLENCAAMRRQDGWKWHDYPCRLLKYHYHYICQFRVLAKRPQSLSTRATPFQYLELPSPVDSGIIHARGKAAVGRGPGRGSMRPREGASHLLLNTLNSHGDIPDRPYPIGHLGQAGHNRQDNGNTLILTAVLCVGGGLALMLLILFLIFHRHQKKKYTTDEPAVHFENVSLNQRETASGSTQRVEEEGGYLTPVQTRVTYDQVSKTVSHGIDRSSPTPSSSNSESLGACGGAPLNSSTTKLAIGVVELPSLPSTSTSTSSHPVPSTSTSLQPLLSASSSAHSQSSIASQPLPPTPPEMASLLAGGGREAGKDDGSYMEMRNGKRTSNLYAEPNKMAKTLEGKPDPLSGTAPLYCNTNTTPSAVENHYEPLP